MNYGIGNVKGKSGGGGGIPQIEILATQFTDATHIQFTQNQYNTIVNNGCVNIDIAGSGTLLFTMQNNSIDANIYLYSVSDNNTATPNAIEFAKIELNKTTYVGTLSQNAYEKSSGGKQLYQHDISLPVQYSNQGVKGKCYFTIINDISSPYSTWQDLSKAVYDEGLTTISRCKMATGLIETSGGVKNIKGVYAELSNNIYYIMLVIEDGAPSYVKSLSTNVNDNSITDTVVAL